MEVYENIQCVVFSELVPLIISKPYYDMLVRKHLLDVVRNARGKGRHALIEYSSMPESIRKQFDEMYPEEIKRMKEDMKRIPLLKDAKAEDFYRRYTLPSGSGLTDVRQMEYVINAQVLNAMVRVEMETKLAHSKNGRSHSDLVKRAVINACEDMRVSYHHTLPCGTIWKKYKEYKAKGYEVLVSGKNGSRNASVINEQSARLIIRLRRSKVPVYTETQILDEYNRLVALHNDRTADKDDMMKEIKSPNTLHNYLWSPEVVPLWYAAVYGFSQFKAKFSALMKTEMPSMRDSLWYSDGTKLNLYYKDAKGKMCSTSVYEVMDAYSEVLLGYDVAPGETFDSQYRAFRNAVMFSGHRPYEIVNDNQGGHNKLAAQGFFNKISALYKNTMPYNGNSKTIESAFGRFQAQVLHKLWYFTGQNITTVKLNSRPDIEFIEANAYALPTLEEVKEIYRKCRDEWNNGSHPATKLSRMEMYMNSENEMAPATTAVDIVQMFWLRSPNAVTYTNAGLKIQINKKEYEYEVYGLNGLRNESWALKNIGRKFHVLYDPMDMTRVELWEVCSTGLRYSIDATPRTVIHRATQERTEEESSYMRLQIEKNKESLALIQLATEQFDNDELIAAELYGLSSPKIKTISKKKLKTIRDKYEDGKLEAPISLPQKQARDEAEADNAMAYQTQGEYTKVTSNITWEDIYEEMSR